MGFIKFSADKEVYVRAGYHRWDGVLEYSYNNKDWKVYCGEEIVNNVIYMRGINNTIISDYKRWVFRGQNIRCQGNIENLLDYTSVINNVHPKIGERCFAYMFAKCDSLVEAPQLLMTELSKSCFADMFWKCIALTVTPMFSNLIVAKEAIINNHMFEDCPMLKQISVNNELYDINVLKLL